MDSLAPLITRALKDADPWKRLTFMVFCCEPMVSNYALYRAKAHFGSVGVLKDALDLSWAHLLSGQPPGEVDAYIARCNRQSPGSIDRDAPYAHCAADACWAVMQTLRCIDTPALVDVIEVSEYALWTGECLYMGEGEPTAGQRAEQLKLAEAEAARQAVCLERLARARELDLPLIRTLRQESEASPPSVILRMTSTVSTETTNDS